jgi:hypothetical protein
MIVPSNQNGPSISVTLPVGWPTSHARSRVLQEATNAARARSVKLFAQGKSGKEAAVALNLSVHDFDHNHGALAELQASSESNGFEHSLDT